MSKHAYLIISHNNWIQLQFLIEILQSPRNDFYILIDSKAHDFDKDSFLSSFNSNNIFFSRQIDIRWGDYSQIQAELILLREAISHSNYDYYHLLSGTDMPLKSQNEILSFFDNNKGYEFVDFDSYTDNALALSRVRYHYLLQPIIGRKKVSCLKIIRDLIILVEIVFRINRAKDIEHDLGKGSNWFSITDGFARYVLDNEDFIKKHFQNTYCCDEVFLQTMLKRSPYKDNWYGLKNTTIQYQNLCYADWERGKPYTFTKNEFYTLTNSEYLFARKFNKSIVTAEIRALFIK